MAIELVSYADLKALLDLRETTINDYPSLDLLRTSVTSAIENFLSRSLESIERTETNYIGAFKRSGIMLPAIPVSTISTVTITEAGVSTEYTENSDYEITEYGIRLFVSHRNVKIVVVYTGGITTVPGEINRAALLQTAYEFQSKDHIGAESVSTEGGNVNRPQLGLLKEVQRMLVNHQHPLRT